MRRAVYLVLGFLVLASLSPVALALASFAVADLAGCGTDGPGFTGCHLLGMDLSETLTIGAQLHWFAFFTLPFGAVSLVLLILLALFDLIRYLRR